MAIIDFLRTVGKAYKKYNGEFGIEIETETKKAYDHPQFTYWATHGDGSLRDYGVEYVLRQPVGYYQEVNAALEEFRDKTKNIPFIKDSISTSVHVHVNMLNESFKTMGNFLTLYSLFENLLIRYSGPDRLSNLFCLPICDAEETYRNMVTMFHNIQAKNYKGIAFPENSVKYAACNLGALNQYGSIEIRSFRGETDVEKIRNWVSVLYQLLEFSRSEVNPKEIIGLWKERQTNLLNDVFKDYRKELTHPDELKLIEHNVWYAASVAYSIKDWNTLDVVQPVPEFKPKPKDLDALSMQQFMVPYNNLHDIDKKHILHMLEKLHYKKHLAADVNPVAMGAMRMGEPEAANPVPPDPFAIRWEAREVPVPVEPELPRRRQARPRAQPGDAAADPRRAAPQVQPILNENVAFAEAVERIRAEQRRNINAENREGDL